MLKQAPFNPHAIESHYGLEMACFMTYRDRPRSVHICADDPLVATAAVRRLAAVGAGLTVDDEQTADIVARTLGIHVRAADAIEPDVTLMIFRQGRCTQSPGARRVVMLDRNALSYKSLLYPGQIHANVIGQLRWLRKGYTIVERVGLFGPGFLGYWAASLAAGPRMAALHFQLGQRGLDRLYSTSPIWWLGYITILAGNRKG